MVVFELIFFCSTFDRGSTNQNGKFDSADVGADCEPHVAASAAAAASDVVFAAAVAAAAAASSAGDKAALGAVRTAERVNGRRRCRLPAPAVLLRPQLKRRKWGAGGSAGGDAGGGAGGGASDHEGGLR